MHETYTMMIKKKKKTMMLKGGKSDRKQTVKLPTSAHFMLITAIFRASCLCALCERVCVCVCGIRLQLWCGMMRYAISQPTKHRT